MFKKTIKDKKSLVFIFLFLSSFLFTNVFIYAQTFEYIDFFEYILGDRCDFIEDTEGFRDLNEVDTNFGDINVSYSEGYLKIENKQNGVNKFGVYWNRTIIENILNLDLLIYSVDLIVSKSDNFTVVAYYTSAVNSNVNKTLTDEENIGWSIVSLTFPEEANLINISVYVISEVNDYDVGDFFMIDYVKANISRYVKYTPTGEFIYFLNNWEEYFIPLFIMVTVIVILVYAFRRR